MTVETNLRAAMAQAVAPEIPDTDRLVSTARRQGLGIRRRRQALGGVGVAAALALAVAAPLTIVGNHGGHGPSPTLVGTQAPTFDSSRTSPITGRSNAAALLYAVGLEAEGTATDFRGQATSSGEIVMAYGQFSFTPAGSSNPGQVGVNVQFAPPASQAKGGDETPGDRCDTFMEHCEITHLADGSVLRTYQQTSSYGDRTGLLRVAEINRADHLRVVAIASNGSDVTERDEQVNRTEPVLTTAQLVDVVSQPWWGTRLPTYFSEQGDQLKPYAGVEPAGTTPTDAPAKP
jgi:hypothetical protein